MIDTTSTAPSISPPHLSIWSFHPGKAFGRTGAALSSANLVSLGRSPSFQKNLHLGSAPLGNTARCCSGCAAISFRHSALATHLGTSTPSGVTPTW